MSSNEYRSWQAVPAQKWHWFRGEKNTRNVRIQRCGGPSGGTYEARAKLGRTKIPDGLNRMILWERECLGLWVFVESGPMNSHSI